MRKIYLDYNASMPIATEVATAMRNAMEGAFGNPSSQHWAGRRGNQGARRPMLRSAGDRQSAAPKANTIAATTALGSVVMAGVTVAPLRSALR